MLACSGSDSSRADVVPLSIEQDEFGPHAVQVGHDGVEPAAAGGLPEKGEASVRTVRASSCTSSFSAPRDPPSGGVS